MAGPHGATKRALLGPQVGIDKDLSDQILSQFREYKAAHQQKQHGRDGGDAGMV